MKAYLRIFLATNFLLLLLVAFLATNLMRIEARHQVNSTSQSEEPPPLPNSFNKTASHSEVAASPYQWQQLETGGCREYIRRLREIGCPERTIRDIIIGDVERLYSSRRGQLRLDGTGAGPWSTNEEKRLIARLLGDDSDSVLATNEAASEPTVVTPLVFATIDARLNLDDGQQDALEELREQFIAEVGGLNQNPEDPAYAHRWQQTQPKIDAMIPGLVGREAFLRIQIESAASLSE